MDILAAIGWTVVPTIDLGPLSVSPHGLGIAVGYGLGGVLTARRAERLYGADPQHIWNALTWAVLGVIVGARLFFIAGHIGDYIPDDPLGIFRIWEGGIVFYGGVFGGVAAAYPYLRKHGLPFKKIMDATAPAFALGLIFGRIGDLVIGDHLGGPTTLPFGFRYQGGQLPGCPASIGSGVWCPDVGDIVHQTALYDLANAIVLLGVVYLVGRTRRFDGFLITFTATWYAVGRFASDYARSGPLYAGFRGTQWVSISLFAFGTWFMLRHRGEAPSSDVAVAEHRPDPEELPAPPSDDPV